MMYVDDLIKRLKYIEAARQTYYDNHFPANCGQIHKGGVLSFDCIGLWKAIINYPDIAYKTSPVGFYVQPGTTIPDFDELGLLGLCKDVKWGDFRNMVPGEYLYMAGHAGAYVGNFVDGSGTVNVIECTTDWGENGVTTSYMDLATGRRFDHLGGREMRGWEAHGKMSKYVDYKKKEEKSMFNDVKKSNKYYEVYKTMVDAGIMTVDKNGNFRPKKHVTRGALAVCLYRVMKKAKMIK